MLLNPFAVVDTVIRLLGVTLLLKIPVSVVVAVVVIPTAIYPRPEFGRVFLASVVLAVAGSVAFTLISLLPFGLIGLLLAIVAYWVIVSVILDRYFDIDYDKSYAVTGQIVIASMALWILSGLAVSLIAPHGRQ